MGGVMEKGGDFRGKVREREGWGLKRWGGGSEWDEGEGKELGED